MSALTLPLNAAYFDQIASGEKVEEFRLVTDYWSKRLVGRSYDRVILTKGYPAKDDAARRLERPWRGFERRTITHPHFGDQPVEVFAINVAPPNIPTLEAVMNSPLRVLDLFSGIGGFSLGLERTGGFETVAFCEINPFARKVLAKHWPTVPAYADVRTLTKDVLDADGITVDVICGGFPCQDISNAGAKAGIEGERSGLWSEIARLASELRPAFVIVENVAALLGRGLDKVLGDLAEVRYDAEWHCIPASAVGAHHRRDRIWIVAYPQADAQHPNADSTGPHRAQVHQFRGSELRHEQVGEPKPLGGDVADTERGRLQGGDEQRPWAPAIIPPALGRYCGGDQFGAAWRTEPNVGRVAHGVPDAMDRLKVLGNAVVPQIPELIARAILAARAAAIYRAMIASSPPADRG
jgi:DNA (cytosine-5)-methyltransferase 1